MRDLTHTYCFVPGTEPVHAPLILFHGSGGFEHYLMPLGNELAPLAAKIGIRGTVRTEGGYAFFHRFPDRRIDEIDLFERTPILAEFVESTCNQRHVQRKPIAIGFSNGAIMAAA